MLLLQPLCKRLYELIPEQSSMSIRGLSYFKPVGRALNLRFKLNAGFSMKRYDIDANMMVKAKAMHKIRSVCSGRTGC